MNGIEYLIDTKYFHSTLLFGKVFFVLYRLEKKLSLRGNF